VEPGLAEGSYGPSRCWRRPRRRCGRGLSSSRPIFTQITDGSDGFELVVPVTVTDRSGTEVVHADITTWVTWVG